MKIIKTLDPRKFEATKYMVLRSCWYFSVNHYHGCKQMSVRISVILESKISSIARWQLSNITSQQQ